MGLDILLKVAGGVADSKVADLKGRAKHVQAIIYMKMEHHELMAIGTIEDILQDDKAEEEIDSLQTMHTDFVMVPPP